MSEVVLDASAILAFLANETGAETVARHLPGATASAVNIAEVASILSDRHATPETQRELLQDLKLRVIPFTEESAYDSGNLRQKTRSLGLSLGDRACLAVARLLNLPVLTADRAWADLTLGIDVRLIR